MDRSRSRTLALWSSVVSLVICWALFRSGWGGFAWFFIGVAIAPLVLWLLHVLSGRGVLGRDIYEGMLRIPMLGRLFRLSDRINRGRGLPVDEWLDAGGGHNDGGSER